jgi:hypothetical protein
MDRYDLQAVKIRLEHCKTAAQKRRVIDDYPEIRGWSSAKVKDVLLMDKALQAGRTIPEQKRHDARKVRWK